MKKHVFLLLPIIALLLWSQRGDSVSSLKIARLKYNGGGDWYSSRTALKNLATYCNNNMATNMATKEDVVESNSEDIFLYPYVFMTGHGNVIFSPADISNLRTYLLGGGFLHICDNYGMDKNLRREIKKLFPEYNLVELPFSHPIYHSRYNFNNGLPKVHKHDNKMPKGYGIVHNGRVVLFYDYECDLGNGWEDAETYKDPETLRTQALQMGANLISYAFNQ